MVLECGGWYWSVVDGIRVWWSAVDGSGWW